MDICTAYGQQWDICFNHLGASRKAQSYLLSFIIKHLFIYLLLHELLPDPY